MEQYKKSYSFPNQFQQECLSFIKSLVDLSSSVFYLIAPDMLHRAVAVDNQDPNIEKIYQQDFCSMDPLNPSKFSATDDRVVTLDSQIKPSMLRQTIYYQDFMVPNNHRYVADMFFRSEGEIIAVMSLLREESMGDYTAEELALLRNLQPFLEYTLNRVYLPKRVGQRQLMEEKFGLTARELDVVELLVGGANNKVIASELALGLPTVKTHIQHIYRKTGVSSRSELLSTLLANFNG
ncbi:MAG: helix-turn-helix transcriptional regulator [Halopseudomonas sp.]